MAASQSTLDNWTLNAADVDRILNGGQYWQYKDGNQYADLTMSNGKKWNPSGANAGVTMHRAGEPILDPRNPGSPDSPNIIGYYKEDTYDISGDTSNLTGQQGSDMHANVQYTKQGDKLVPVADPSTWNWAQQNRAANSDFATSVAMLGAGAAGGYLSGAGAASSGTAGLTELGIAGTPVASGEIAATGLLEPGAAAAAGGAGAGGLTASEIAAGAKTAASTLLDSGAGKLLTIAAGGLLGSQPTTKNETTSKTMDPRLDKYVYGDGTNPGLLSDANSWYQQNKSGLNQAMLDGLNAKYNNATDPTNLGAYKQMVQLGSGLLSAPIAGNPFTQNGAARQSYTNQGIGQINPNQNPFAIK